MLLVQVECLWNHSGAPRLLAEEGTLTKGGGMLHAREVHEVVFFLAMWYPNSNILIMDFPHGSVQISATQILLSRIFFSSPSVH